MYSPIVRLLLVFIWLYFAWNSYIEGNFQNTVLFLFAVALTIWGYYKNGTVFLSFSQLKKQNFEKAEALINSIKSPEKLKNQQRAYYFFSKGFIDQKKGNIDSSLEYFRKATEIGLRTKNDEIVSLLNIASLEMKNNNEIEAKKILNEIESENVNDRLKPEIEKLKKEITLHNSGYK